MHRKVLAACAAAAALSCGAGVPAATAQERAFTLLGSEPFPSDSGPPSLPRTGTDVASELSREVADVTSLADGRVAVLTAGGAVDVIGVDGRLRRLARVPGEPDALDAAADGSLLVVSSRLWHVGPDGRRTLLTPDAAGGLEAVAAAAMPDGGYAYAVADDVERVTLFRVGPDGARRHIGGNGGTGPMRPGDALRSSLPTELQLDATAGGELLLAAGEEGAWLLGADGTLRRLGGADRGRTDPADGSPLASASLESVEDLSGDPSTELVLLDGSGALWTVRDGVLSRRTARFTAAALPLWAGAPAPTVYLDTPGAVERTSTGEVLFTTGDGVGVLATPGLDAPRLAVAVAPRTLASIRRGQVAVASTRRATVALRAMRGNREVARIDATVEPGLTTFTLPRGLPPGVVRLLLRARDERGAVATHRFRVLGRRQIPVRVARRVLRNYGDDFNTSAVVRRCRRRSATEVSCRLTISSEAERIRGRASVRLRADGWLQIRFRRRSVRAQLF